MDDLWRETPWVSQELDAVRRILDHEIHAVPPELKNLLSQVHPGDGKMLRPGLVILSSRFGSPDPERIRRIAAAVEIFHLATLIHDDVIDDSAIRRGRKTLYAARGARAAVLAGDFLFSRSFLVAAAGVTNPGIQRLSSVVSQVCASEVAQSEDLFRPSTSTRRYRRRIAGKTAALFAGSCHLGASESGCGEATTQILRRMGYDLGMAFQIVDDILDLSGSLQRLGKPVGQDLREGVFTLPVICALRADGPLVEPRLRRLGRRASAGRIDRAIGAIASAGGIEAAWREARLHTDRALREIDLLPDGENRRLLAATARALLGRTA